MERVIEALDRGPHAAGSTVAPWSGHGWRLGEKLHWRKFALREEAAHNVLTMRAPGVTKAADVARARSWKATSGASPGGCRRSTPSLPRGRTQAGHLGRLTLYRWLQSDFSSSSCFDFRSPR